ncbi:HK97 gp10 family phage protein [Methylorubrum sp. Q1]|uniref:HK97 gp10 family phage protein n=1 Tax=Methylorubrum sp. Q1 TaxID=2562453 RepID=UPI001076B541|nr:HK97 gp10 family phage protein [Methylorubrum sp. Q1]TFZ59321.1 HK97 gp10 family phage protein [Methylorubrum sp. Q1]
MIGVGDLLSYGKIGWGAVSGVDAFANALAQYSVKLVLRSKSIDAEAAADIVERAQAAVPRDSGRLFGGIQAQLADDVWTVSASAINPRGRFDMDYAFLVEHGTQAGVRGGRRGGTVQVGGRSRAGAFNPETGRRYRVANANRTSARTHPGTQPQPYFYPAVDAVMEERGQRQAETLNEPL